MSTYRARRIVFAMACIVPAHQAAAQTVMPGARVRVVDASSNNPLMVGELVRLIGDSVTILSAANLASSATRTVWVVGGQHRLEVSTDLRRRTGRGIGYGFLVGAAAGAVIGAVTYRRCVPSPGYFGSLGCMFDYGPAANAAGGAIVFAIPGMLIGGMIGHSVKSEVWRRVDDLPVRVGIAPALGRGVLLTASVAF
jgi:hypothetical protein